MNKRAVLAKSHELRFVLHHKLQLGGEASMGLGVDLGGGGMEWLGGKVNGGACMCYSVCRGRWACCGMTTPA